MHDLTTDREAIRDLLTRYTYNGDRARLEGLAAAFAEDGVLEFPGGSGTGPAGIVAALTGVADGYPRTFVRHHITNPMIDIDGDTATARSYFHVFSDNGPDHAGTYDDRLVRTAAGWRFSWRRVRIDWQSPTSTHPRMPTR